MGHYLSEMDELEPRKKSKQTMRKLEVAEEPKKTPETVELPVEGALALALASERVQSAKINLELRQTHLQATLAALRSEFSESGKYTVTEIDVEKRTVSRVKAD
jgi:hypothetical protein